MNKTMFLPFTRGLRFTALSAIAAACMSAPSAVSADTQVIWFDPESTADEYAPMGQVYAMSESGEYAVITDDEMNECYLWRRSDPTKLTSLNWEEAGRRVPLELRGVNDAGTVTGSYRPYGSNAWKPFVMELGGEPVDLPVASWTRNLNYPCAISNDGAVIGGYLGKGAGAQSSGIGQSLPVIWVRGDDGEYSLVCNEQLSMPHQGFPVNCMYTDGTAEGTWLGGSLYCGVASTIPALYHNGEIIKWNELTSEQVPWWYKGEVMGYDNASFIDGKRDLHFSSSDVIESGFFCADRSGNFYGTRMIVGPRVTEDKMDPDYGLTEGDEYRWGYFNTSTGEWHTRSGNSPISCALNPEVFFVNTEIYRHGLEGESESLRSALEFSSEGHNIMGVSRASADGKVLGLTYSATDAMGVMHAYPFMLLLDEPLSGVHDIIADRDNGCAVIAGRGTISVTGAETVSVYDLNGSCVSTRKDSTLPAGTYIVKADARSYKVLVF